MREDHYNLGRRLLSGRINCKYYHRCKYAGTVKCWHCANNKDVDDFYEPKTQEPFRIYKPNSGIVTIRYTRPSNTNKTFKTTPYFCD